MDDLEKDLRDFISYAMDDAYLALTTNYDLETTEVCLEAARHILKYYRFNEYFKRNDQICEEFFRLTEYKPYTILIRYNKKISNKFFENEILYNWKSLSTYLVGDMIKYKRVSEEFIKNNMYKIPPAVWSYVYE